VLLFLIEPAWMRWSALELAVWLRWVGVGLGAAVGLFIVWTFRHLGKNLTDTVVTRKEHTLVTTGPYRWVRHPFYVAIGLNVLALFLATANWFVLLTGSILFFLIYLRTRKEEENLVARFGAGYRDYMARTGRFWPRWWAKRPE
jgi:protein-S-isoprenylcysteine O-methyltransferase Ste14